MLSKKCQRGGLLVECTAVTKSRQRPSALAGYALAGTIPRALSFRQSRLAPYLPRTRRWTLWFSPRAVAHAKVHVNAEANCRSQLRCARW